MKNVSTNIQLWLVFFLLLIAFSVQASTRGSYLLNSGDVIRIHVYGEEELSFNELLVGDSGVISYPFLGEIHLRGMTLGKLEKALLKGLKPDYLIDPKITVSVVKYRPFFMSGEVKKPGGYPFQPGISLRQAITLAGGFTERASKSKLYVVPVNSSSSKPVRVDLNYQVQPGDTITIEQSFF